MPRVPVCPYYGRTKKEQIVCLRDGAGTFGRGELRMNFPSQVCRLRYWMQHCCGDWEACSLSPALAAEYELHKDDKPFEACYNKAKENANEKAQKRVRRNSHKLITLQGYLKWSSPEGLRSIEAFAREGLSKTKIAKSCGCSPSAFKNWAQDCPEIDEAIKRGLQDYFQQ